MPETQASAWWTDVEHLREGFERRDRDPREEDRMAMAARRAARERRNAELEAARAATRSALTDAVPRRRFARASAPRSGLDDRPTLDLDGVDLPATPTRRTVQITGRTMPAPATTPAREAEARYGPGDEGSLPMTRRRPSRGAMEHFGARPDRVALWALLMGLVLILVAVGTADASTLP